MRRTWAGPARSWALLQRRCGATTAEGGAKVPAGMFVMREEPEFEGEPGTTSASSAAKALLLPHGFVPPRRTLHPQYGHFRKLRSEDFTEIESVYRAYCNYYDHMKFRKGWETPFFDREKCRENWMGAAEYVVRIRRVLDEQQPGQKLRMKDGAAQEFFHSPAAKKLGDGTSFEFLVALVHATLRDAVGYVEGLNRQKVSELLRALSEYRYNPKIHALHNIAEIDEVLQGTVMPDDTPAAVMEAELSPESAWLKRHDEFYVANRADADKKWREGIAALYAALEHFQQAQRLMRSALVETEPPKH